MSENIPKYISPGEWDPKKGERTPEFVNSYLHYVGLKCLTDSQNYKLDPDTDSSSPALPDLHSFEDKECVQFIDVSNPRGADGDDQSKSFAEIDVYTSSESIKAFDYPQLFLGKLRKVFPVRKSIQITWEIGQLIEKTPTKIQDQARSQVETPYYSAVKKIVSVNPQLVAAGVNLISTEEQIIQYTKALESLYVKENYLMVFEDHHQLLLIGHLAFLCTNLRMLLNPFTSTVYSDEEARFGIKDKENQA